MPRKIGTGRIKYLNEFRSFVRAETGIFISGMAVSGLLIFNNVNAVIAPVFLTVFLACCVGYGCNNLSDKKEDMINNKRLNFFVTNNSGLAALVVLSAIGLGSSLLLPFFSFVFYIACFSASVIYSAFRVKNKFLLKNLYTGFSVGGSFLVGATSSGSLTPDMMMYYLFVFAFGFMLNVLGDIRGYMGDMLSGVKTIPVVLGIKTAKGLVYSIIVGCSACLLLAGATPFYPLIPFMLAILFFVSKDNQVGARISIISSFSILPFFLFTFRFIGGI